jgi:hypothetical protein
MIGRERLTFEALGPGGGVVLKSSTWLFGLPLFAFRVRRWYGFGFSGGWRG